MSMLSKQLQTADIRWSSSFGDWAGGQLLDLKKKTRMLQKYVAQGLTLHGWGLLHAPKQWRGGGG
jgi:hypothetical protein